MSEQLSDIDARKKIALYEPMLVMDFQRELYEHLKPLFEDQVSKLEVSLTYDESILLAVYTYLESEIFPRIEPVTVFLSKPIKCVQWLKMALHRLDEEAFYLCRTLYKIVLNSERVFDQSNGYLKHIKSSLDALSYPICSVESEYTDLWIRHFMMDNKGDVLNGRGFIELQTEAYFRARGLLKTEDERIETILREDGEALMKYFVKNQGSDFMGIVAPHLQDQQLAQFESDLIQLGLFDIDSTKCLFDPERNRLVNLLFEQRTPYCIALLHEIGFIYHLAKLNEGNSRRVSRTLSLLFSVDERAVRGNIAVLEPHSQENRSKFTSHNHVEQAQKDFETIKNGGTP